MKRVVVFLLGGGLVWAELVIEPEFTKIGGTFTVKGSGFGKGEEVLIEGPEIKKIVTSNDEGGFMCEFNVSLTHGGEHVISATSPSKIENSRVWIMPTVKLVPNSGSFGDEIGVFGMGYGPRERIQIGLGRQHMVAEAYASELGTFSAKFNLSHHPKGENRLFAIGHGTYLLCEETFIVNEKVSLEPKEGYVGCGIGVSGSGFKVGEEVRIDFGTYKTISTCTVTRDGDFSVNFASCKVPGGNQIIKVTSGDFEQTLPFFIKPRLVSIEPKRGYVGKGININLDGLIKDEVLTIGFDTRYATYTIGEDGAFSEEFIVETMPGGNKVITITTDSGIFHTQIFEIRPSISFVTPLSPLTGQRIVFGGVGFLASEKIRVDFGPHEAILWVNADEDGSFIGEYTIQDPPGNYRLVAIGYTTYQAAIAQISVVPPKTEEEPKAGEEPKAEEGPKAGEPKPEEKPEAEEPEEEPAKSE